MTVPTGAEFLIKNVLKMIGIKADDILIPLAQIKGMFENADARLLRIEQALERLEKGKSDGTT